MSPTIKGMTVSLRIQIVSLTFLGLGLKFNHNKKGILRENKWRHLHHGTNSHFHSVYPLFIPCLDIYVRIDFSRSFTLQSK